MISTHFLFSKPAAQPKTSASPDGPAKLFPGQQSAADIFGRQRISTPLRFQGAFLSKRIASHPVSSVGSPQEPLPFKIEKIILTRNEAAFRKILPEIQTPLLKRTLEWAAECGQPEKLEALLKHAPADLTPEERKNLRLLAGKQADRVKDYQRLGGARANQLLRKIAHGFFNEADLPPRFEFLGKCFGRLGRTIDRWLESRLAPVLSLIRRPAGGGSASVPDRHHFLALLQTPGLNINQLNRLNETLLHAAARSGKADLTDILLKMPGIDLRKESMFAQTPLIGAVRSRSAETVRLILQAPGVDVNQPNQYGDTALHRVVEEDSPEIAAILLHAPGIQPELKNRDGKTPWDLARQYNRQNILRLYESRSLSRS